MELSRALAEAVAAAREAGRLLRDDFHRPSGPRGAGDKADADVEAERTIRVRLLEAFPAWGFVGEETGRVAGARGEPLWLVDPNDGTRDYLRGRRGSTVSIGLLVAGRPTLGVVYAFGYPDDEGDLFAWAEGCGPLQRNGHPCEVTLPGGLGPADVVLVSSNGDRDPESNFRCAEPARYRTLPSIAHRLALVAAGEAAAATSLHAPGAWDYAAGQALLRAAGAVLLDEEGREVGYGEDGASSALRAFGARRALALALAARPWHATLGRVSPGKPEAPVRPRPGETVADAALLSRAQGCLLGQVAGDSLGGQVEFASAAEIAERHADGPRRLEDGGRWGILAGQPTDDSEMALGLARSIVAEGRHEPEAVLRAYRQWYRSDPFDLGQTTRAALVGYVMGSSQANGSLMRMSPLGVFAHALAPQRAAELARQESALTHPHPVCRDACAAFVVAVAHAVREGGPARAAYHAALDWARGAQAEATVVETLLAADSAPPVCDGDAQGWVLLALRNAFFEALNATTLEQGVVRTVRRGGDTDTNAAIAGALLGALHGRESVPPQWRQAILSCRPHPLRAKRPRPMSCWPVDVLDLAERLLVVGEAASERPKAADPGARESGPPKGA